MSRTRKRNKKELPHESIDLINETTSALAFGFWLHPQLHLLLPHLLHHRYLYLHRHKRPLKKPEKRLNPELVSHKDFRMIYL